MEIQNQSETKQEWRMNVTEVLKETTEPKQGRTRRFISKISAFLFEIFVLNVRNFFIKAWGIAVAEPKKVIHGVKVGLALSIVSTVYYMRPLYNGLGGNAMWAIMTVVVVFEYTVGATLAKSFNRVVGTLVAGSLGLGVHWVAQQSSKQFEPVVIGFSVFVFASAATFSRFVPSVKSRFDYGAMIFILTFSLVSISGYRVEKLMDMARHRLSTIAVGTGLCIFISLVCCPIWAGEELHNLIHRNMEKLADSLDGCADGCFGTVEKRNDSYKSVLDSKAIEDQMANIAKWELPHRRFGFRQPWQYYLKVGASMRKCAYCLETLNGIVSTEIQQASDGLKMQLREACMRFSSEASEVVREMALSVKKMKRSSEINLMTVRMRVTAEELQNALRSLPHDNVELNGEEDIVAGGGAPPIVMVLALVTVTSLVIEIAAKVEDIVGAVNELATKARFKSCADEKLKHQLQRP